MAYNYIGSVAQNLLLQTWTIMDLESSFFHTLQKIKNCWGKQEKTQSSELYGPLSKTFLYFLI
jgi:hypothetical protein